MSGNWLSAAWRRGGSRRRSWRETGPYRLLKVAAEYCRAAAVLAIWRRWCGIPDVFDWLLAHVDRAALAGHDPLTVLDEFATERVPATLDAKRLERTTELAALRADSAAVEELFGKLPAKPQPLPRVGRRFRGLLAAVYGERMLDRNAAGRSVSDRGARKIDEGLAELAQLPPAADAEGRLARGISSWPSRRWPASRCRRPPQPMWSSCSAGWNCRWTTRRPSSSRRSTRASFRSRPWPMPFLPNRLRQQLGLLHNDRRYARDAYATVRAARIRGPNCG